MAIRIVNVRGVNDPAERARIVYVGRRFAGWPGHILANPFKPGLETVPACLDRYRAWLANTPLEAELEALWHQTEHGAKPLGCWCITATAGDGQAIICHAQILAEMLASRFAGSEN